MNEHKAKVWFALFVLAVFCTGAAAGFVMNRVLARPPAFLRGGPPPGAAHPPPPEVIVEQLTRELALSAEQRTQLESVLASRKGHLEEIQLKVRAMFDEEQQSLRADVVKILTAEQQERFDRWLARPKPAAGGPGEGHASPAFSSAPFRAEAR